jgi:serine/threonine protein kinase
MLTGRAPWPDCSNAAQAILRICSHTGDLPSEFPAVGQDGMTAPLHKLLARCLARDPAKRPTAAEVLNDEYFK